MPKDWLAGQETRKDCKDCKDRGSNEMKHILFGGTFRPFVALCGTAV